MMITPLEEEDCPIVEFIFKDVLGRYNEQINI